MVRKFTNDDISDVMDIWLQSTVKAHSFIAESYWSENFETVKNKYIPNSDTYIYEENGKIYGFISIMSGDFIGAVFVDIEKQAKGIGTELINFVKNKYDTLKLNVYKNNEQAVKFYFKHGFKVIKEQTAVPINEQELVMQWNQAQAK